PLFDKEIISMKIDPHHFNAESDLIESILNHDSSIISSSLKIDSLLDEFADDPMPPGINEHDYDSERDMLIFEELLSNDSLSTPENESFHFDIPSFSRPPAKPPNDDSGILTIKMDFSREDDLPSPNKEDKFFNPGILIHEKSVKIITRFAQEKKLVVSYASSLFEDFDPPFYELLVFN
nr:hypothetical protein [Tanacetum cinerariifolium]